MNERTRLERAALAAHRGGDTTWNDFYAEHGQAIAGVEPWDLSARSALVRRLSVLVAIGNLDGHKPVGDDEAPWDRDDAIAEPSKRSDSHTSAKINWTAAGVAPVNVGVQSR